MEYGQAASLGTLWPRWVYGSGWTNLNEPPPAQNPKPYLSPKWVLAFLCDFNGDFRVLECDIPLRPPWVGVFPLSWGFI